MQICRLGKPVHSKLSMRRCHIHIR